jgi:hypothetical protein
MCLKINGSMPNAGRGLSLKKFMNIREFGIVSRKRDTFVQCSTCETDFSYLVKK